MTNQSTIDKLIEMRLTAMADAFRIQMDDPAMKEVPFEDRFGMLVDVEYSNRKNNRLKRLIRQAEFEQPDASIAAIDYHSGRKLNKALIYCLATCEYITEYRNIFITGATGSGKTYMACAFGMEACKHYYSVRYVRLPDLLLDLQAARDNGTFSNVLKKYTKPIVLILDEWLLLKLTITPLIIFSFSDLYSNITFRSNIVSVFSGNFLPASLFIHFSGCIHIIIFSINFLDRVGCCIYFCIRCCGYCHTGKHRQDHTCSY